MTIGLTTLGTEGLRRFDLLRSAAAEAATQRFYALHPAAHDEFGAPGRRACREDMAFHLEFLRPLLEFGVLQPMVDYLCWLASVLATRSIPVAHVALSLQLLGEFFVEHLDAADGRVVADALRAAQTGFLDALDAPAPPTMPCVSGPEVIAFEAALLAGNQREALAVVTDCIDHGQSLVDIELHVIRPSLYDIGEKWQANQISVAKEHMATAIAQSVMTMGLLHSPPSAAIDKRALLACVEQNHHAVGLRMVADAFQLGGWDVQYLGADVPTPALVREAAEWQPDLIGLSVAFPQHLRIARDAITRLAECLGTARPPVLVGGLAINRFGRLAEFAGADACSADPPAAVARANQMLGC
jgi:MerR family transcriptional regulator, light-induced transcriptional regulator